MIPKVRNIVEPEISEGNTKRNPHVIVPAVMVAREDQDEGITQLRENDHIRIREAIQ